MTWITVQLTNAGFGWIQWKEWTCMRQSKWSFVSSPPFFRHLTDIVINDKVSPFQLFSTQSRQPGVVVWAAPEQQKAWDRPGTLLFAVKLFHQPGLWSGWLGWVKGGGVVGGWQIPSPSNDDKRCACGRCGGACSGTELRFALSTGAEGLTDFHEELCFFFVFFCYGPMDELVELKKKRFPTFFCWKLRKVFWETHSFGPRFGPAKKPMAWRNGNVSWNWLEPQVLQIDVLRYLVLLDKGTSLEQSSWFIPIFERFKVGASKGEVFDSTGSVGLHLFDWIPLDRGAKSSHSSRNWGGRPSEETRCWASGSFFCFGELCFQVSAG